MTTTTSRIDKSELEKTVQQMLLQLEELRTAIKLLQDKSIMLSSEVQEMRMAYDTLNNIQKLNQVEVMSSLDRQGYVYVKVRLENIDKAIVRIGRDFYAVVPIDTAKNVLLSFEKDVVDELRKVEAELKQLTNIYSQLQNKLQEYVSILTKEDKER